MSDKIFVRKCKECGQLYNDQTYNYNEEMYLKNNIVFTKGSSSYCPICYSREKYKLNIYNSAPRYGFDWFFQSGSSVLETADDSGKTLAEYIREEDSEEVKPQFSNIISYCQSCVDNSRVLVLDNNKVDLSLYLRNLQTLKTAEYSLEMRLFDLLLNKYALSLDLYNTQCRFGVAGGLKVVARVAKDSEMERVKANLLEIENRINKIIGDNKYSLAPNWNEKLGITKPEEPIKPMKFDALKPMPPQYGKPGLFNKKAVLAQNEQLKAKYESELESYNSKKAEYDVAIADYNEKFSKYREDEQLFLSKKAEIEEKEYEKWHNNFIETNKEYRDLLKQRDYYQWAIDNCDEYLNEQIENSYAVKVNKLNDKDIEQCKELLSKAYQATHDFLSVGVLFPKYATLAAVTTINEYLMSGRCNELTGPDGAYNLYESEIRADRIIEKLDDISDKLDKIAMNQYMLYQAVQSVNSELRTLNQTANDVKSELKLANNTLSSINECGFRKNCNGNSEYLQLESGFSANAINSVIRHSFLNILTCGVQKLILCHL